MRQHPLAVLLGQYLRLLHARPALDNYPNADSMLSDVGEDNRRKVRRLLFDFKRVGRNITYAKFCDVCAGSAQFRGR